MKTLNKGSDSKGNTAKYTLPLNPASVRSVLSLFDKDDLYTDEAFELNSAMFTALMPVVKEALQKGFSIREIIHVLHLAVTDLELDVILDIPLLGTRQTQIKTS